MAARRFVLSGAMKCLIEKRSYRSWNTHTAISIALSTLNTRGASVSK